MKNLLNWIVLGSLLLMTVAEGNKAFAQEDELGAWYMYFGAHKFHPKLSLHTEVQYRNHEVGPSIEQLLLRTGINWHFAPQSMLTAGYGRITNYVYESEQTGPEKTEHRVWQQLIMRDEVARFQIEHRYRVEQRWVEGDYANRLRYRLFAALPLNNKKMGPKTVFLAAYDEIFVNTEQTYFDRNRLYVAAGYQFSPNGNIQVGYMRQAVNAFSKNHLQVGLTWNTSLLKKEG